MNTADQLIQGYAAYTTAEEFGAAATAAAPATTPVTTTVSTAPCGGLVSAASAASIGFTADWGC
ncbi:LxmA leader domain family RiPP [Streptomyces sp. NBC_00212]|uniref:LxmA leader domain family RiPP n=1 Tax=Streptomyces sp. NBC_00212 TaxID=2975684 RepID=UPI002F90EC0C